MTTSLLFTLLAAATHLLVIKEVRRFFKSKGSCQEADKHIVATLGMGSITFVLIQGVQLVGSPGWYITNNIYAGLWSGFAILNASLYYATAKILADRRTSETGSDMTDLKTRKHNRMKAFKHHYGRRAGDKQ